MSFINLTSIPLIGYPGFPRPVGQGTPGDRWGATAVRGPRETVEKETVGWPQYPAASRETDTPVRVLPHNTSIHPVIGIINSLPLL